MITDQTLFLLATAAGKAAPERPALPAGKIEGARWALRPLDVGAEPSPGEVLLSYDGATVGASTMITPTASVSMYGVLARALKHAGCTRESISALVVGAVVAELRGEVDPVAEELEEQVGKLRAAFAASLPKVPRAGAVKIANPTLEVVGAVDAAATEPTAAVAG